MEETLHFCKNWVQMFELHSKFENFDLERRKVLVWEEGLDENNGQQIFAIECSDVRNMVRCSVLMVNDVERGVSIVQFGKLFHSISLHYGRGAEDREAEFVQYMKVIEP